MIFVYSFSLQPILDFGLTGSDFIDLGVFIWIGSLFQKKKFMPNTMTFQFPVLKNIGLFKCILQHM